MRRSRSDEWAQLIKNFCRPIFANENIFFSFFFSKELIEMRYIMRGFHSRLLVFWLDIEVFVSMILLLKFAIGNWSILRVGERREWKFLRFLLSPFRTLLLRAIAIKMEITVSAFRCYRILPFSYSGKAAIQVNGPFNSMMKVFE